MGLVLEILFCLPTWRVRSCMWGVYCKRKLWPSPLAWLQCFFKSWVKNKSRRRSCSHHCIFMAGRALPRLQHNAAVSSTEAVRGGVCAGVWSSSSSSPPQQQLEYFRQYKINPSCPRLNRNGVKTVPTPFNVKKEMQHNILHTGWSVVESIK